MATKAKKELKTNQITLDVKGPLAVLTTRKYKKEYTEVPDSYASKYVSGLNEIRQALNSEWSPSDDSNTLLVKSEGGVFSRLYGPKVYKGVEEGTVSIRWGKEIFSLSYDEEGVFNPPAGLKVALNMVEKNLQLRLMVVVDGTAHIMSLPLATDYDTEADELAAQFDVDPAGLLDNLMEVPTGGGSVDITEIGSLEIGMAYEVTGVKPAGKGVIVSLGEVAIWSPMLLQDFFRENPEAAIGGSLTVVGIEPGEPYDKIDAVFEKDELVFRGTPSLAELTPGNFIMKTYRTFSNKNGNRAIAMLEIDGFIIPYMTSGVIQSQLTSGVIPADVEQVMETLK
jgi:hypothetical protein